MVSAGVEILETSSNPALMKTGQTRPTVVKSKLREVSVVDIGGNDDAIVLSFENKELKLSAEGDCAALPLINNLNNDKKMELKLIAHAMGLPETATEAEIVSAINANNQKMTELQQRVDGLQLAGITSAVDAAIAARKITADKKDHFIGLGKTTGIESLRLTFEAMSAAVKPADVIGAGATTQLSGGSAEWKKLSDVPENKLLELRENDRTTYARLYKAEYGIECLFN